MLDPKVIARVEKLVVLTVRGDTSEAQVARARMDELVETFDRATVEARAAREARPAIEHELALLERLAERHELGLTIATKLLELIVTIIDDGDAALVGTAKNLMQQATEHGEKMEEALRWRAKILAGEFDPLRRP